MNHRRLAALLALFLLSAPMPGARAETPEQAAQSALAGKVDALAAEHLAQPGAVGFSIAVAQHGKVLLSKGYGKADLEFDVPADEQTMFRVGSVTKQFTAAIVMRLVERGKLALDDELAKHVPEFPLQGRKVTILQLLQHTSGIKDYTEVGDECRKLWPLELSHGELLALIQDAPFDFEPGSDWRYDNSGYYLLGMVIEKVTGQSYAEALQSELCVPLGLARTRYDSNRELIRNRAQGYAFEGGTLSNDQMIGMAQPGAGGGIVSTAGDLVRWQMALASGRVVKPESYARMCATAVLPDGRETGYGFGLFVDEWAGRPRMQHSGDIFGFNAMLVFLPGDDLHVAVISNGETISSIQLVDAIGYAALGIERPKVKDDPIPADRIALWSGDYAFAAIGLDAKAFEREGKFLFQAAGQSAFRLQWQGGAEFRASFDEDVRLVFAADGKSVALHQNGARYDGLRR